MAKRKRDNPIRLFREEPPPPATPEPLTADSPRLTELDGPRDVRRCQRCGAAGVLGLTLRAWQEHDEHDQPEPRAVALCGPCETHVIEPHPRLYRPLKLHEPFPGVMPCCAGCRFYAPDRPVRCANPTLRANGGSGMMINARKSVAFMDGVRNGRRCGWQEVIYFKPAVCRGRESTGDEQPASGPDR